MYCFEIFICLPLFILVFMFPCKVYDEMALPQPYLPGEMLKLAISWDLTSRYKLVS